MKSGLFFQSINGKEIENRMKIGKRRKMKKKNGRKMVSIQWKMPKNSI